MVKLIGFLAMIAISSSSLVPPARGVPALRPEPLAAVTTTPDAADGPVPLVLAYFGGTERPSEVRERVGPELAAIFDGVPIEITWVDGTSIRTPTANGLRVIFFDRVPGRWGLPPQVLGAVIGSEVPRAVVYVFYRNVVHELGHTVATLTRAAVDVAKALAHVIAHELVHAYAPGHRHRGYGLMAPRLGPEALLRRSASLDRKCLNALLEGLAAANSGSGIK